MDLTDAAREGGILRRLKAGVDKIDSRSFGYVEVAMLSRRVVPNLSGCGDSDMFVEVRIASTGGYFGDRHVLVEGTVVFHRSQSGDLKFESDAGYVVDVWSDQPHPLSSFTVMTGKPDSETTVFTIPPTVLRDESTAGVNGAWMYVHQVAGRAVLKEMQRIFWEGAES